MNDSKDYYNTIAHTYDEQSKRRMAYLNSIDQIIIKECQKTNIKAYLDIGSGDGRRGLKIAKKLTAESVTLLDNSSNMLSKLPSIEGVDIVNTSFFDYKATRRYDLITCLWNVIGHFKSKDYMKLFFDKVSSLLSKNGVLILDINNRYNITHYGYKNVMRNMQNDFFKSKGAGWFSIGDNENKTKVYINSPYDIFEYIENTDLIIESEYFIDYESGAQKETFFEGQLLYILKND